jgi:hypothetical protein
MSVADRLHALTLVALEGGDFAAMERAIAQGHTAAWLAGTAERLGVTPGSALLNPRNLSRAERAEIKARVAAQLRYLEGFRRAAPGMSEAAIRARAAMYAGAVRQTYMAARWGDWDIPPDLMPGNQTCMSNCRCDLSVRDHGDGTGTLTRTLGGEQHCDACPPLAGDHPVRRKAA